MSGEEVEVLQDCVGLYRTLHCDGIHHIAFPKILFELGLYYSVGGKHCDYLYQECLDVSRTTLNGTKIHSDVSSTLHALAGQGKKKRVLREAEKLCRECYEIDMKQYSAGVNHQDIATSLYNVASTMLEQGALSEADHLYRSSLTMFSVGSYRRILDDCPLIVVLLFVKLKFKC